MFLGALRLYASRPAALLLTTAIALAPVEVAHSAAAAALRIRLAPAVAEQGGTVPAPQPPEQRLRDRGAGTSALPGPLARSQDALEAIASWTGERREVLLADAIAFLATLPLLTAGLYLAAAATLPLVAARGTRASPSRAWAEVGARFGPLMATDALAALLCGLGVVVCVLPGIALAIAFAFALPIALAEHSYGVPALRRSLHLASLVLPRLLLVALLIVLFRISAVQIAHAIVEPPRLLSRLLLADAISLVLYPLPIATMALLYFEACGASAPPPRRQALRRPHPA